jgi:hypothetical protein
MYNMVTMVNTVYVIKVTKESNYKCFKHTHMHTTMWGDGCVNYLINLTLVTIVVIQ